MFAQTHGANGPARRPQTRAATRMPSRVGHKLMRRRQARIDPPYRGRYLVEFEGLGAQPVTRSLLVDHIGADT